MAGSIYFGCLKFIFSVIFIALSVYWFYFLFTLPVYLSFMMFQRFVSFSQQTVLHFCRCPLIGLVIVHYCQSVDVPYKTAYHKSEHYHQKGCSVSVCKLLYACCKLVYMQRLRKLTSSLHFSLIPLFIFRIVLVGHFLPEYHSLDVHCYISFMRLSFLFY